jgi:hypothetical protein
VNCIHVGPASYRSGRKGLGTVAANTTGEFASAPYRTAPWPSLVSSGVHEVATPWLGDRVTVGCGRSAEDATVIDVLVADEGTDLVYTVHTDSGANRTLPPGSLQVKPLFGRLQDEARASRDGKQPFGMPMTAAVLQWLTSQLDDDKALMSDLVRTFAKTLMWAETDRSPDRVDYRKGHRPRVLNTQVGKVRLLMPRLGAGHYFPDWLFERPSLARSVLFPYVRSEFLTIVRQGYLEGVSPQRVVGIVQDLGISNVHELQFSSIARVLDDHIRTRRSRPMSARPHPLLRLSVLSQRATQDGVPVQLQCVVVTGGTASRQEVLDLQIIPAVGQEEWLKLLRSLVNQGLDGVETVIAENHEGLKEAAALVLPRASWLPLFTNPSVRLGYGFTAVATTETAWGA